MPKSPVPDDLEARPSEERTASVHRFLDAIVENFTDMIFVKDAQTLRFARFNRAGEELLGLKREDLLGKSDFDIFPADVAEFFVQKDREVLAKGTFVTIPEEPIETRHRGRRVLSTKKIPIFGEDGEPLYLVGISRDITEVKLVQDELRQNKDAADRAASAFLANMSHELRTALNGIIGFSDLLEQQGLGPLNKRQAEYVRHVLTSGRQLLGLMNDIFVLPGSNGDGPP